MKKCSFTDILDDLFWYIVYLLPIIGYLIYAFRNPNNADNMLEYFELNFSLVPNIIESTLQDIFGTSGIFPLFENNGFIISFLAYFVGCVIIHLAVDFLLFIPRLSHKWMSKFVSRGGSLS